MSKRAIEIFIKDSVNAAAYRIPYFGAVWEIAQAFLNAPIKAKQERALEWLEHIRNNPRVFTKKIFQSEAFQDGFVYLLEKYLKERSKEKRENLRSLLYKFAKSDFNDFELERYSHVIEQLTSKDMKVLSVFSKGGIIKWEKQQGLKKDFYQPHSCLQYGKLIFSEMYGFKEFEDDNYTFEVMKHLETLGIVTQPVATWGSAGSGGSNDHFKISEFGIAFLKITKS